VVVVASVVVDPLSRLEAPLHEARRRLKTTTEAGRTRG